MTCFDGFYGRSFLALAIKNAINWTPDDPVDSLINVPVQDAPLHFLTIEPVIP